MPTKNDQTEHEFTQRVRAVVAILAQLDQDGQRRALDTAAAELAVATGRREIVISYDPADLPADRDDSWAYDMERELIGGDLSLAMGRGTCWGVPVTVETRGPAS